MMYNTAFYAIILIFIDFFKQVGTKLKDMRMSILSSYSTSLMNSKIIFKAILKYDITVWCENGIMP